MRKSIFLVVVALFSFTACVADKGTPRDFNKSNSVIFSPVYSSLSSISAESACVVYSDLIAKGLNDEAEIVKDRCLGDCSINVETSGIVTMIYRNYQYTVYTNAKPLSEAGEWRVDKYYKANIHEPLLLIYKSIEGVNNGFKLHRTDGYVRYNGMEEISLDRDINIEATYTFDSENDIILAITGSGNMVEKDSCQIDFTISNTDPLILRNFSNIGIEDGTVSVVYRDLVSQKSREFDVTCTGRLEFTFN